MYPTRHFGLLISPSLNPQDKSRFGVILSKKIAKSAVDRNLYRRRLHEVVGVFLPQLKPGYNVIILVKHQIVSATFVDLQHSMKKALSQAGLFILNS
jgi:ribonuclease P protein component